MSDEGVDGVHGSVRMTRSARDVPSRKRPRGSAAVREDDESVSETSSERDGSVESEEGERRRKPRWTADEDERLVELVKEGKSWLDIAGRVKREFGTERGEAGCAMRWYNHLRKLHNDNPAEPIIGKRTPGQPSMRRNRRWTGPSGKLLVQAVKHVKHETDTPVKLFRLTEHWGLVADKLSELEREQGILKQDEQPRDKTGCRARYYKLVESGVASDEDDDQDDSVSSLLHAAAQAVLPRELRQATQSTSQAAESAARGRRGKSKADLVKDDACKTPSGKPQKLHVCPVATCAAAFKRAEHLKRHWRGVHLNAKPFACSHTGCDKSFSRRDNLQQHMQIVHRYVGPASALPLERGPTLRSVVVPSKPVVVAVESDAPPAASHQAASPLARTAELEQAGGVADAEAGRRVIEDDFGLSHAGESAFDDMYDHHHHHHHHPSLGTATNGEERTPSTVVVVDDDAWHSTMLVDPSLGESDHQYLNLDHSPVAAEDDHQEDEHAKSSSSSSHHDIRVDIDPHLLAPPSTAATKPRALAAANDKDDFFFDRADDGRRSSSNSMDEDDPMIVPAPLGLDDNADDHDDLINDNDDNEQGEFGLKELDELNAASHDH